jgi:hypothetical protein
MNESVNACAVKYFGVPRIIRNEAANVLKNMLFAATPDEIGRMEKAGELPACLTLLAGALWRDIKAGRTDAFLNLLDAVF